MTVPFAFIAALSGLVVAAPAQAQLAPPGTVFRDCADCPEMVVVPAGRFVMGSPDSEEGRTTREGPQHPVSIGRPFALSRHEVTRGQFAAFVADSSYVSRGSNCWHWDADAGKTSNDDPNIDWRNPDFAQGDDHPVVCVSWDDAKAYAAWMARRTGKGYRLPTEAEWEYAARAGSTGPRPWGLHADDACSHANVADRTFTRVVPPGKGKQWNPGHNCDDKYAYTAPVGRYRASAFGLQDMMGNVWEWVEDCFSESYAGAPEDGSASLAGDCGRRGGRGGGWSGGPRAVRAADRGGGPIDVRFNSLGIRLARTE